jgi:hypothetical protein
MSMLSPLASFCFNLAKYSDPGSLYDLSGGNNDWSSSEEAPTFFSLEK